MNESNALPEDRDSKFEVKRFLSFSSFLRSLATLRVVILTWQHFVPHQLSPTDRPTCARLPEQGVKGWKGRFLSTFLGRASWRTDDSMEANVNVLELEDELETIQQHIKLTKHHIDELNAR